MPDRAVQFRLEGRFAHFLVAEGGASAPSYPLPPRTALLGLVGAVLGLPKDEAPVALADAEFAVSGGFAHRHWHMANLRKDPPSALPATVKKGMKGSSSEQRNTRLSQEYLVDPAFTVTASLPGERHAELDRRLRERAWHFTPCLGQSELLADLTWLDEGPVTPVPPGTHPVTSAFPRDRAEVDLAQACADGASLLAMHMPCAVTPDRRFTHRAYFAERSGKPVQVRTDYAVQFNQEILLWL